MSCGSNCMIFRPSVNNLPPAPPLVKFSKKVCGNCRLNVSEYSHDFCYRCAPKNSIEYNYHHSKCISDESSTVTEMSEECDDLSDCDDDDYFSDYIPHVQMNVEKSNKKTITKFFESFMEYLSEDACSKHFYANLYEDHRCEFEEAFKHFMKYHVKDA